MERISEYEHRVEMHSVARVGNSWRRSGVLPGLSRAAEGGSGARGSRNLVAFCARGRPSKTYVRVLGAASTGVSRKKKPPKMFDVFGKLGALLKIDPVSIDNITFRFHYKVTMIILVTFSLLVTSRQYFGDPISCIGDEFETEAIDVYCWIQSTFTIPALTGAIIGVEVAHPGVASLGQAEEQYVVRHHKYYQWVTLFLFFQVSRGAPEIIFCRFLGVFEFFLEFFFPFFRFLG